MQKKIGSILSLDSQQDRTRFDCGEPPLNDYLQKFSFQHKKSNLSRTFVITLLDDPNQILGFYTLSAGSITFNQLPEKMGKFPRYPIPIVRIGRLAIDKTVQGMRLGESLLMDALCRCTALAEEIGIVGVVVDAKHEKARQFYLKYGFYELSETPLSLIIPIREILEITRD